MPKEEKTSIRQHDRLWDSVRARVNVYTEAAERLVELGEYNRHTEQEMCILLQRLGGEVIIGKEELDSVGVKSFTVMIEENDEGEIICKTIKLKD